MVVLTWVRTVFFQGILHPYTKRSITQYTTLLRGRRECSAHQVHVASGVDVCACGGLVVDSLCALVCRVSVG